MPSTSNELVTTVFISNLHCSSCVRAIQDALSTLAPPPSAIDISIVAQTVTVRHSQTLSPEDIKASLDEASFDIVSEPTSDVHASQPSRPGGISLLPPGLSRKHSKHIQQCSQCQLEQDGHSPSNAVRDKLGEDTIVENSPRFKDVSSLPDVDEKIESEYAAPELLRNSVSVSQQQSQGPYNVTLSVGGMTCASCTNTLTRVVGEIPGIEDVVITLLANSATFVANTEDHVPVVVEAIEDAGYDADVITVESAKPAPAPRREASKDNQSGSYHVTLSIGGMTCASCVNTINALASDIPGVSDTVVNLLGKFATATLSRKEVAEQLVEAIEDGGYEAEVVALEPVGADQTYVPGPRSVALRIEGMFCAHCPEKVMALLKPLEDRITIEKALTSYTDPILRLSYTPSAPDFTIRTIIEAINISTPGASHPFTASVHHAATLEERARVMQARELRGLLYRLVSAVILAIPTFIIAVVYMSLVPSTNTTREWWMRPIWNGNAARVQWALLFIATPAMFYSAGLFHRRALKELWSIWRKGSRLPVWKRFVRFGSMNMLVSSGVAVAYFASIALLALAASQSESPTGDGDSTTYFDSVVFLSMFLLAGRYLEAYSKGHTADAITTLGKLRPTFALLLTPSSATRKPQPSPTGSPQLTLTSSHDSHDPEKGPASIDEDSAYRSSVTRIPADLLEVGDIVRVQHGSTPPSDGTLVNVDGEFASFDESSLTGESRLVKKVVGDSVFVGTINRGAVVDVRVDAIGGETMLDHVVKVVREGQSKRAPIERVADILTGYFVPVVTLLAIITWIIWLALGHSGALPSDYLDIPVGGWTVWSLEFAIAVFVVACPCGIGLAAPTALLVGSGLAAKFGILVRGGGEAFQEAAQLDLVVFDKTGTLTEGGDPRVVDAELPSSQQAGWQPEVVLGVAAELESASTHPLASAIRAYCSEKGTTQSGAAFDETAGRGVKGRFDALGCEAIIGNEAWMSDHGAAVDGVLDARLSAWKAEGNSVVLLALRRVAEDSAETEECKSGFEVCAVFAVADPLRPEASAVVAKLQGQGIGTWMISGDNPITAQAVARKVGILETNVIAGVLPHEKALKIQWLQQVGMKRTEQGWFPWFSGRRLNKRCIVAMVGDGINDAPALSAADVGIAIGSGSDVAISSASFILVSSELRSLLTLIDLSRTVFNRVKFNFLWATVYNAIALPIAAGVIYPASGHPRLAPVWASLSMALSSVSVVCSSLMLKLYKEPTIILNA